MALDTAHVLLAFTAAMTANSEQHQARAFFGRRKGHKLRARQAELMASLLPRLAVDIAQPPPADLTALFPVPVDDIQLEIGFGGGENMIAQATARPRTGVIGVEPFVNGMAKALTAIEAAELRNVRLHFDDATGLMAWLPYGVIGAHRSDSSRPMAEAAALEAALRSRRRRSRNSPASCAAAASYASSPTLPTMRPGHCGISSSLSGFRLDRRTRRRLAQGLAGFHRHPLSRQSGARTTLVLFLDLPAGVSTQGVVF